MMIQFQCQCADCLFTDYLPPSSPSTAPSPRLFLLAEEIGRSGWNMLLPENHDHPRHLPLRQRHYWKESGKTLAAAMLFSRSTPFIYQGQEIGMLNWQPESADMYEDVQTRYNYAHSNLKRARTCAFEKCGAPPRLRPPVQWDDSENAGFTTGTPWFYVNKNYTKINVAQQNPTPTPSSISTARPSVTTRELPVVRQSNTASISS